MDHDEEHRGEPEAPRAPVVVEPDDLSPEALRGLVESFVLREGTDYGAREVDLERKVADVMRQLARREARIVFDPGTESVDIQVAAPLRRPGS